jgi:hypothetical protein
MKRITLTLDDRIRAYVEACPSAVSGEHGSHRTFAVTCALVWGFGLDKNRALEFLQLYNERCQPPWTDKDLRQKIKYALKAKHKKPRGYLR